MKVIRITDPKKALQFLKCIGVDKLKDIRSGCPFCDERVPDINYHSNYRCDRASDVSHDIHVSWWDIPDNNRPVEIWGEGLTELHYIIAKLL